MRGQQDLIGCILTEQDVSNSEGRHEAVGTATNSGGVGEKGTRVTQFERDNGKLGGKVTVHSNLNRSSAAALASAQRRRSTHKSYDELHEALDSAVSVPDVIIMKKRAVDQKMTVLNTNM